ncbi:MAG: hypothetical protein EZS28_024953 [Streblomastix strix]|uniref:Uncharacterized protein n=1 Tax=Streblomastix strix TaxID=222440 RepID=A0A5J4VAM0_9EUKA|nr:MAG: hypothetical protein EZS28_024953 [Streblomastix strix]
MEMENTMIMNAMNKEILNESQKMKQKKIIEMGKLMKAEMEIEFVDVMLMAIIIRLKMRLKEEWSIRLVNVKDYQSRQSQDNCSEDFYSELIDYEVKGEDLNEELDYYQRVYVDVDSYVCGEIEDQDSGLIEDVDIQGDLDEESDQLLMLIFKLKSGIGGNARDEGGEEERDFRRVDYFYYYYCYYYYSAFGYKSKGDGIGESG